ADDRGERGGAGPAGGFRQRAVAVDRRPEGVRLAHAGDEILRGADDLQGPRLAFLAGRSPRGDAVPAEDAADGLRVVRREGGDVQAQLEAWPAPWHPGHAVAEALARARLPVGRGGQGDARVRMQ